MDSTSTFSLDASWRVDPPTPLLRIPTSASSSSSSHGALDLSGDGGWGVASGSGTGSGSSLLLASAEREPNAEGFNATLQPYPAPGSASGPSHTDAESSGSGSSTAYRQPSPARPLRVLSGRGPGRAYGGHGHGRNTSAGSSFGGTVGGSGREAFVFGAGAMPVGPAYEAPPVPSGLGGDNGNGKGKGKGRAVEDDDAEDEQDGPMRIAVLANVMDTSKGRDKVLKCVQYSLRTYLYLLSLIVRVRPLSPWFRANRKRMQIAVSGLSLTRKCLLLLNPLHPLAHLLSPAPTSARELLLHLLDLASALSDDLFCLSKLGIVSKRLGARADRWSNRLWLFSTLMGLYKLHLTKLPTLRSALREAEQARGAVEDHGVVNVADRRDAVRAARKRREAVEDAEWAGRKYLADLVFVSYDVLDLTWAAEPIKCATGMLAALISTSKLYDGEWSRASLGKG